MIFKLTLYYFQIQVITSVELLGVTDEPLSKEFKLDTTKSLEVRVLYESESDYTIAKLLLPTYPVIHLESETGTDHADVASIYPQK